MKTRIFAGAFGICIAIGGGGAASAQVGAGDTIEQRIERLRPPAERRLPAEEAILTGKEDIVLLRRAKLFTLRAEGSYRHTDNAFLSDDRKRDDDIFTPSVALRAGTRIAERYDVFVEVSAFTGQIGVDMPAGDWRLAASYSVTPVYQRGLDDHIVTLHDLGVSVRRTFVLDQNTALQPSLALSRVFADPDDFATTTASAGLSLVRRLGDGLFGSVSLRGQFRRYDDFFEQDNQETREDTLAGARLFVLWQPIEWASLAALVDIARNWSTVDANDYTSLDISPTVSLTLRF